MLCLCLSRVPAAAETLSSDIGSIGGRAKVEFWTSGGGVQYIRLQKKSSYVTK